MPDRAGAYQFVILAQPKPIFNMPTGSTRFDDIFGRLICMVGYNNIFAEHVLLSADLVGILAKGH